MLLKGELAHRLDSTPRIQKLIDNWANGTPENVNTVKEWLQEEFLTSVKDLIKADV